MNQFQTYLKIIENWWESMRIIENHQESHENHVRQIWASQSTQHKSISNLSHTISPISTLNQQPPPSHQLNNHHTPLISPFPPIPTISPTSPTSKLNRPHYTTSESKNQSRLIQNQWESIKLLHKIINRSESLNQQLTYFNKSTKSELQLISTPTPPISPDLSNLTFKLNKSQQSQPENNSRTLFRSPTYWHLNKLRILNHSITINISESRITTHKNQWESLRIINQYRFICLTNTFI